MVLGKDMTMRKYGHAGSLYAILSIVAILLTATSQAAEEPEHLQGPNLIRNPGFEDAAQGDSGPAAWKIEVRRDNRRGRLGLDTTTVHMGRASLKWTNPEPGYLAVAGQWLSPEIKPGARYDLAVWIKTQDLQLTKDRHDQWWIGPQITLRCFDAQRKDQLAEFTSSPKLAGTRGWTRVGISGATIPPGTHHLRVECVVSFGLTGTVWFDDAELRESLPPPLETFLLWPNYRGWIFSDSPHTARIRARLNPKDHHLSLESLELVGELMPAGRDEVLGTTRIRPAGETVDLSLPLNGLAPGEYRARVVLRDTRANKTVTAREHPLRRVADSVKPQVFVDEHRRLIVDGKPFFPIGMISFIREDKMQGGDVHLLADAKFNCLVQNGAPSRQEMDLAYRHHLKVIYCLDTFFVGNQYCPAAIKTEVDEEAIRNKVRTFRDHPALLGWYTYDEPDVSMLPRLERHQRWVEEEDLNHPTWVVMANPFAIRRFAQGFDVVGADPYPIPFHPVSLAAGWTQEAMRQLEGSRPLWMVPQAFSWRTVHPDDKRVRMPTPEEMRCMTWQCICEGATGIIFNEWWGLPRDPVVPFDVSWGGLKRIATEIEGMTPALLSIEPVPELSANKEPWLHWLARSHGGKLYVMAVNDGSGSGTATFHLPAEPRNIRVVGENRAIHPSGAVFSDVLEKLAVQIYEVAL